MTRAVLPTPALRAERHNAAQVRAWCPFCGRWHLHGWPEDGPDRAGHRAAHCPPESQSPFRDTGYYLIAP